MNPMRLVPRASGSGQASRPGLAPPCWCSADARAGAACWGAGGRRASLPRVPAQRGGGSNGVILMNLDKTTCVITGGSEGIGYATASALGKRGARIALCARTDARVEQAVRKLNADGITAVGRPCDVADAVQVSEFAAFIRAEAGPADVLVNNAGVGQVRPRDDLRRGYPSNQPLSQPDTFTSVTIRVVIRPSSRSSP